MQVGTDAPLDQWTAPRTFVTVLGQKVTIKIQERLKQVRNTDPKAYPRVDLQSSGRLTIQIDEWADNVKKLWVDTDERRVEDCLNDVVLSLVAVALLKDKRDQEAAAEQEELRIRQEKAAREAEVKKQEKTRRVHARRQLQRWCESQEMIAFVAAGRELLASSSMNDEERARLVEWYDWVEVLATSLMRNALTRSSPATSELELDDDVPEADGFATPPFRPEVISPAKQWHPNLKWYHNR